MEQGRIGDIDFVKRMAVVARLAEKHPGMGRTALMKYMYLLQAGKQVPLGYRFELYVYGPYDASVLSDLAMAEAWDAVEEKVIQYPSGYGYSIHPGDKISELKVLAKKFLDEHNESIEWVVNKFKDYSAAELELIGTMVWADREAKRAKEQRTKDELIDLVLEIKPRFSKEQANTIVGELKALQVLQATF